MTDNEELKPTGQRKNCIVWRLKNYPKRVKNGCWEWQKYKNEWGYGRLRHNGKKVLAHRASYEVFKGDFDKNLLVCHSCDNPSCVNPDHLFLGTNKDNVDDCISKGRHKGHLNSPFKKGNDYARKE